MRRILAGAMLILSPAVVVAETCAWDAVTNRSDGSPLLPGELVGYRLYQNATPKATALAPETSVTIPKLARGGYTFTVSAIGDAGQESAPSEPLQVNVTAGPTPTKTPYPTSTAIKPKEVPANFRLKSMSFTYEEIAPTATPVPR